MEKWYYLICGLVVGYSLTHIFIFKKYSKVLDQLKERTLDLRIIIKLLKEELEKKWPLVLILATQRDEGSNPSTSTKGVYNMGVTGIDREIRV